MGTTARLLLATGMRVAALVAPAAIAAAVFSALLWGSWELYLLSGDRFTTPMVVVVLFALGTATVIISRTSSRRPLPRRFGVPLERETHADLWAMVDRAALGAFAPFPRALRLVIDTDLHLRLLRPGQRAPRALLLAAAPLCAQSPDECVADLTRAMVEWHTGPLLVRRALQAERRATRIAETRHGGKSKRSRCDAWKHTWTRWHTGLADGACRDLEAAAAAAAERVAGLPAARSAGPQRERSIAAWHRFVTAYIRPASSLLRRPMNVVEGFQAFLQAGAVSPVEVARNEGGTAIDRVGAAPDTLVRLEIASWEGTGLTPLTWDELANAVATRRAVANAAGFVDDLLNHDGPSDLGSVVRVLEGHESRQAMFQALGLLPEVSDPDQRDWAEQTLGFLVGELLAAALVEERGASFRHTWHVFPLLVDPDGSRLDPWSWAYHAVKDPGGDWLAVVCRTLGLSLDYRPVSPGPELGRTVVDSDPAVLASAVLYTPQRARYLFVLDTGLVIMRPRMSDLLVGGLAQYAGDGGGAMLRRWRRVSGRTLLEARGSTYIDWSDVRSLRWHHKRAKSMVVSVKTTRGERRRIKGGMASRFAGNPEAVVAHFLGDRFIGSHDAPEVERQPQL